MRSVDRNRRILVGALTTLTVVVMGATAAWAIESEGEMFVRDRLVGNLGIAHADIGVYPDRAAANPAPAVTSGSEVVVIPEGATVVDSLVYWAGRGPGWSDDQIRVNGVTVGSDTDYHWRGPGWDQTTYVADLDAAGVALSPGSNSVTISDLDHFGERNYGAGVIVIFDHPSLPEVELELLEGNEFAFFKETYFDAIGNAADHTNVSCTAFAPALEERALTSLTRVMGVDAGRGDGPARTQRLQWWTGSEPITAPISNGIVGLPTPTPQGSVDNPVPPRVAATAEWGSSTYETTAPMLAPGDTNYCTQLQSVSIGDGVGASLSLTNQGTSASTVYRLGNLIWLDDDADGMAELGERGIDGVTVELWRDGAAEPLAITTTANDGAYVFEGLLCGDYRVVIPDGQMNWNVAGVDVDPADLNAGAVNNPTANDDADNDNNAVATASGATSGVVVIGDCGEDGDFSNGASNEPTDETDRKGGPDDDPDDLSVANGNYDDVRSNVSVDFAFEEDDPNDGQIDDDDQVGDADPDDDEEVVTTEVEGQVEETEDLPLAITGSTTGAYVLGALIALVLGVWFLVAERWLRPVRR